MNDEYIILLLKSGREDKGLDKLYNYFPKIKAMVLNGGGSVEDAHEVFQQALLIFVEKVKSDDFKLTSAINTYLFSTCKYLFWDMNRRKARFKTQEISEAELPEDLKESQQEVEEKEKQFTKAAKILEDLGERCKELLRLFYLEKKSMKEIAQMMGFQSDKVAKNQKYKCLERAKKHKE